jgi:hypothetical protein
LLGYLTSWKGCGRKWWWVNGAYSQNLPEKLGENHEKPVRIVCVLSEILNELPPRYKFKIAHKK